MADDSVAERDDSSDRFVATAVTFDPDREFPWLLRSSGRWLDHGSTSIEHLASRSDEHATGRRRTNRRGRGRWLTPGVGPAGPTHEPFATKPSGERRDAVLAAFDGIITVEPTDGYRGLRPVCSEPGWGYTVVIAPVGAGPRRARRDGGNGDE